MSNMCVTKDGYKSAEAIRFAAVSDAALYKQLTAIAQIVLNAADAVASYKKLWDVSSNGLRLEEDLHSHVKGTYWPAETQMLEEFTQPTPREDQAVLSRRYAGRMWAPIAASFAKAIKKLECEKPRYCGNMHTKRLQQLLAQRSGARANVLLFADRIAFFEIEAIKDVDHERSKQAIAQRQGLFAAAASLMAEAQKGFAGLNTNAMSAVTSGMETFMFERTRQRQADAGFGSDPFFHQQIAANLAGQQQTDPYGSLQDPGGVSSANVGVPSSMSSGFAEEDPMGISPSMATVSNPGAGPE